MTTKHGHPGINYLAECQACNEQRKRAYAARRTPEGRAAARRSNLLRRERYRSRDDATADLDYLRLHPNGLKTCTACHQEFAIDQFYRKRFEADGRKPECRSCHLARVRVSNRLQRNPVWDAAGIDPRMCFYCRGRAHVGADHVQPRARGGTDDPRNVLPACIRCNRDKSDSEPIEWIVKNFPDRIGAVRRYLTAA
jgi:hypothetical protein